MHLGLVRLLLVFWSFTGTCRQKRVWEVSESVFQKENLLKSSDVLFTFSATQNKIEHSLMFRRSNKVNYEGKTPRNDVWNCVEEISFWLCFLSSSLHCSKLEHDMLHSWVSNPDAQLGISSVSFAKYVRHFVDINCPAHKLEGGLEFGLQHSVLHGTSDFLLTVYNKQDCLNPIHGLLSLPSSPSDWQWISCWHSAEKDWGFRFFY